MLQRLFLLLVSIALYWILACCDELQLQEASIFAAIASIILFAHLYPRFGRKYTRFKLWASLCYILWLARDMFISAHLVIKIVWQPIINISPTFGFIKTVELDNISKALYASSITLTPGTLTLKVEDDFIVVHTLNEDLFQDLLSNRMQNKLQAITVNSGQKVTS